MKAEVQILNNNFCLDGIAVGHTQLCHPVQSRASDQHLRGLSFKPSRTHSFSEDHLHAKHRRLCKAPSVIAHFLFPLLSPHCTNPPQVLIADQALCFAVAVLPDVRPLLRRDRRSSFACPYRFIAVALVVCLVARYLIDLLVDLFKQIRQHLPVSEVVGGDDRRHAQLGKHTLRFIWNRMYTRPQQETFHEFIVTILMETLGKKWWDAQVQMKTEDQHIIMRWYNALWDLVQSNASPEIKSGERFEFMATSE